MNQKYINESSNKTLNITIDKEYFRKKFKDILDSYILQLRLCEVDQDDVLKDLMKCFDEES